MNKAGKTNVWLIIGAIALVLILAALVYKTMMPQTVMSDGTTTGTGGSPVVVASGCNINPSVVNAITDAANPGTAVTPTNNYRIDGVYTSTTAPTTKGTADILLTAAGYLNKIKTGVPINCGSNLITDTMQSYTNATLTYYSNNGLVALTQSTANETAQAAGGSYNWKLHFQGVDKKATGKQLVVVELSTPANVSSVSMSGAQSVAVPNGYARQLTNGYAAAFLLPAINGNTAADYNLAVASATSTIVSGQVYTTVYSVEPFVETDGTFSDQGLAFNSLNVAKWHDKQTKNFIIA